MNKLFPSLILGLLAFSPMAHAGDPLLPEEGQKDFVTDVLPYDIEFVHDHIAKQFSSEDRNFFEEYPHTIYALPPMTLRAKDMPAEQYDKFLKFPIVRANKFYVFYGAYPNMQSVLKTVDALSVIYDPNPALQRYSTLSADDRAWDFYIWSPDTPYWYSEYSSEGHPVPFRSYFIIHLSAVDDDHTSVEVIEYHPVVQMGEKQTVDASGLHRFDIRSVAPTTADREFLLGCVRQFIEKEHPDRKLFNCRAPGEPEPQKPVPFTTQ